MLGTKPRFSGRTAVFLTARPLHTCPPFCLEEDLGPPGHLPSGAGLPGVSHHGQHSSVCTVVCVQQCVHSSVCTAVYIVALSMSNCFMISKYATGVYVRDFPDFFVIGQYKSWPKKLPKSLETVIGALPQTVKYPVSLCCRRLSQRPTAEELEQRNILQRECNVHKARSVC